MVVHAFKSTGGFLWACGMTDAKVQANFVGQGFGSLGLMTSLIETKDKITLCETVHGTIDNHTDEHNYLGETSSNSISTIFAWSKALLAKARLDKNYDLIDFALNLERITIETVMRGQMTQDLSKLCGGNIAHMNTQAFVLEV